MSESPAITQLADSLRGRTVEHIRKVLDAELAKGHSKRLSAAERNARLDFNARLMTALRERKVWPT